jgi:hypothetical protein
VAARVAEFAETHQNLVDSVVADFPKFGTVYPKCGTIHIKFGTIYPKFDIKIGFGHIWFFSPRQIFKAWLRLVRREVRLISGSRPIPHPERISLFGAALFQLSSNQTILKWEWSCSVLVRSPTKHYIIEPLPFNSLGPFDIHSKIH